MRPPTNRSFLPAACDQDTWRLPGLVNWMLRPSENPSDHASDNTEDAPAFKELDEAFWLASHWVANQVRQGTPQVDAIDIAYHQIVGPAMERHRHLGALAPTACRNVRSALDVVAAMASVRTTQAEQLLEELAKEQAVGLWAVHQMLAKLGRRRR